MSLSQNLKRDNSKGSTHDEDGFFRTSVTAALTKKARILLQESLYGYDIDATMVRLGLMNLMMHGIDEPHIDYQDTLSKSYSEETKYDIVLANPPFTGSIDRGDINENLKLSTTKTELLFVENIYRLLKKGGTACVIVPQGVLFGSGKAFKELRQTLVERCDLKAVITLPSGVFKPYAGVSTAILLFSKVFGPGIKFPNLLPIMSGFMRCLPMVTHWMTNEISLKATATCKTSFKNTIPVMRRLTQIVQLSVLWCQE